MSLTQEQYVRRAVRQARGGQTEEESGIWFERGLLLLPTALDALCARAAHNALMRPRLQADFSFVTGSPWGDNGTYFELSEQPALWAQGIRHAEVYVSEGEGEPAGEPLQWRQSRDAQVYSYDAAFGTFSVARDRIYARGGGAGAPAALTVRSIYVPQFDIAYPLPIELEDTALMILADLLRPVVAPTARVRNESVV